MIEIILDLVNGHGIRKETRPAHSCGDKAAHSRRLPSLRLKGARPASGLTGVPGGAVPVAGAEYLAGIAVVFAESGAGRAL